MNHTRLLSSLFPAGLLAGLLAVLPAAPLAARAPESGAQTMAQRAQQAKKIKDASTRKVWTNEELQRLQGGWGVNVVGASAKKPEAAAPAGQAAPQQPTAGTNFYSDLSMEERQQWIDVFEREIADDEAELAKLRDRALSAATEDERATANQQIVGLEQAIEANRAEIELIRKTPPPKAAKPAAPKPAPAPPSS